MPTRVSLYGSPGIGIPIAGDWTGTGAVTIGLYSTTQSVFYLRNSNSGGIADTTFVYGPAKIAPGSTADIPIVGDWDGNGTDTIGLYDPTTSVFYLRNSNSSGFADVIFAYGPANGGLVPIAGDWNGDGTDTIGLYDPRASVFYLKNSNSSGFADTVFAYGAANTGPPLSGAVPLVGDWNGDGTDTIGLFNATSSVFYLRNSNSSGFADITMTYGPFAGGLRPLVGAWAASSEPLLAANQAVASASTPALTQAELQPIVQEAIARWANAGLNAAAVQKLTQAQFVISDLPGSYLGETVGNRVTIDVNAAGNGWFVDPTPASDEEFASSGSQQQLVAVDPRAVDRIDLLTVVEHELGHVAGLGDLDPLAGNVMSGVLGTGVRRIAS